MVTIPRFPLRLFFRDKIILISLLASLLANIGLWLYLPLSLVHHDRLVFLHYTVHLGVDFVGAWGQIFTLPLIGLIFLLINLVLSYFLYHEKFFSRILLLATFLIQLILWMQALFLVYLNF